jgi:hypothetical protein
MQIEKQLSLILFSYCGISLTVNFFYTHTSYMQSQSHFPTTNTNNNDNLDFLRQVLQCFESKTRLKTMFGVEDTSENYIRSDYHKIRIE